MTTQLANLPTDCCFAAGGEFRTCQLCGGSLETVNEEKEEQGYFLRRNTTLAICPKCGWWTLGHTSGTMMPEKTVSTSTNTFSILSECKIGDKDMALGNLRRHLTSNFDDIYQIHPRKLEEIIYSVFREHGFEAPQSRLSCAGTKRALWKRSELRWQEPQFC